MSNSNDTTDNFWAAWAAWDRTAPPPVFYRLYYDDSGMPIVYSMEDLPGNYIEIDHAVYARQSYHVRIVDQQLVAVESRTATAKLIPDSSRGTACSPGDVSIVVADQQPHIKWTKKYES
jgi:hypothetical protein